MNGGQYQHPQYLIEREKALATIARQLNTMLALQREIEHHAAHYSIEIELPPARILIEAIAVCASINQPGG